MEQNIYIPGDLITTNGVPFGTTEGVVYRVKAMHPDREVKLKKWNSSKR